MKRNVENSNRETVKSLMSEIDYAQIKLDLELNEMSLEERADFLLDTFRG
jgi:hypothetical protein